MWARTESAITVGRHFLPIIHRDDLQRMLLEEGAVETYMADETISLPVRLGYLPGALGAAPTRGSKLFDHTSVPLQRRRAVRRLRLDALDTEEIQSGERWVSGDRIPDYSAFTRTIEHDLTAPGRLPKLDAWELSKLDRVEELEVDAISPLHSSASAWFLAFDHGNGMQLGSMSWYGYKLFVDLRAWLTGSTVPFGGGEHTLIDMGTDTPVMRRFHTVFKGARHVHFHIKVPRDMVRNLQQGELQVQGRAIAVHWLKAMTIKETDRYTVEGTKPISFTT